MRPIKKMRVIKFRGIEDQDINFQGKALNAIIGQNASMKTTLLAMIATPFALKSTAMNGEKTIGGEDFGIKLEDRTKFSKRYEKVGDHEWELEVDKRLSKTGTFPIKSYSRTPSGDYNWIRFWQVGKRGKGDTLLQCPVIYLSLSRLFPIGELNKIERESVSLNEEEEKLYVKWHSEILITDDQVTDMQLLMSANKNTLIPETDYYDALAVSAGQDNIGRIILAILSMKRLKEKYPDEYKGSIICIDEIESTLYPASQVKLLRFMKSVACDYDIQFFFTTHSMSVITELHKDEWESFSSITYAKKVGQKVKLYQGITLEDIRADLFLKMEDVDNHTNRISVYCEDSIGMVMTEAILGREYTKKQLKFENFNGANLGYTNYLQLLNKGFYEFHHSIIILDGDVKTKPEYSKLKKYKNVVFLPSEHYPEQLCFLGLKQLDPEDDFWDNRPGHFSKQLCFNGYEAEDLSRAEIKNWFKEFLKTQRKVKTKRMINMILDIDYPEEVSEFRDRFRQAYERLEKTL